MAELHTPPNVVQTQTVAKYAKHTLNVRMVCVIFEEETRSGWAGGTLSRRRITVIRWHTFFIVYMCEYAFGMFAEVFIRDRSMVVSDRSDEWSATDGRWPSALVVHLRDVERKNRVRLMQS